MKSNSPTTKASRYVDMIGVLANCVFTRPDPGNVRRERMLVLETAVPGMVRARVVG
jgi:hypothetical protein